MKKCEVCKRVFDDSQSFCLDDGTALISDQMFNSAETVVMTPPLPKTRLPIILAGILLFLIGGGGLGWWLSTPSSPDLTKLSSKTNTAANPTPNQTATRTATPTPDATPEPTSTPEVVEPAATNSEVSSVSKPVDINDPTRLTPIMKTEDHFVLFNLHQCRKSGGSITCDLTFTNKGPDRRFQFVIYRSNLFDELGNTYEGKSGRLASIEDNNPRITFVSGVTAKAQMTFDGVQPNATKITLLRIQYDVGNDNGLEIKFRNVPLLIPK